MKLKFHGVKYLLVGRKSYVHVFLIYGGPGFDMALDEKNDLESISNKRFILAFYYLLYLIE